MTLSDSVWAGSVSHSHESADDERLRRTQGCFCTDHRQSSITYREDGGLTLTSARPILFFGSFSNNLPSKSTTSLPSTPSPARSHPFPMPVQAPSLPIDSGTLTPSLTMTLYNSYSVRAMKGVSPKRRQKSVTPRAHTSIPLPMVGRNRGALGEGGERGREMTFVVRRRPFGVEGRELLEDPEAWA